jgi:hypothetical protein
MGKKPSLKLKNLQKVEINTDSVVESDEYIGFIIGYTSNGAPYGLTHEEWEEINPRTNNTKTEDEINDLPF